MKKNIRNWPVMPAMCASCPFQENGDIRLRNSVMSKTCLQASQICHHPRLHGKKATHLCRGGCDFQLTILYRLEMITEPTDAAFTEASDKWARSPEKSQTATKQH